MWIRDRGQVGDIVHDADGELALHLVALELVIHGEHGGRRRVLAAQTVTAADDLDVAAAGVGQRGDHILIQGLAQSAGCLLYTSDAADDLLCVELGGRRILQKKTKTGSPLRLEGPSSATQTAGTSTYRDDTTIERY